MAVAFALPTTPPTHRPIRLARLVIERLHLHPPIDLDAVARAYRLRVRLVEIPDEVDGHIAYSRRRDRWAIFLNLRYRDPARRRMTLAHELGHYVLHRQLIAAGDPGPLSNPWLETEAYEFAAELLMPADQVRLYACLPEPERVFRVSRSAWLRRVHELADY